MSYNPTQHKNPFVVGICGLAGSGKSTISRWLSEWTGWQHLSADDIAHEKLNDEHIKGHLLQCFGQGIFNAEGMIERKRLAALVFACKTSLGNLEACLWPEIKQELYLRIYQQTEGCIIDAAVLYEAEWNTFCDRVIFVEASERVRSSRLFHRGMTAGRVTDLLNVQKTMEAHKAHADWIICNDSDHEDEIRSLLLEDILPSLQAQSKQKKGAL